MPFTSQRLLQMIRAVYPDAELSDSLAHINSDYWVLIVLAVQIEAGVDIPNALVGATHLTVEAWTDAALALPRVKDPNWTLTVLDSVIAAVRDEAVEAPAPRTSQPKLVHVTEEVLLDDLPEDVRARFMRQSIESSSSRVTEEISMDDLPPDVRARLLQSETPSTSIAQVRIPPIVIAAIASS